MAEGLLRHRLAAAGAGVEVRSAGVLAGGVRASTHAVDVLAARGIDLARHESRAMAADEIAAADLVVGMQRRHVREAIVLVPEAEAWSFTLKDLVARAEATEARAPGESLRDWAARLAAGRTRVDLLGEGDDTVDDPIGGPRAAYERTAAELDDLLARLVLAADLLPRGRRSAARTAREAS